MDRFVKTLLAVGVLAMLYIGHGLHAECTTTSAFGQGTLGPNIGIVGETIVTSSEDGTTVYLWQVRANQPICVGKGEAELWNVGESRERERMPELHHLAE